MASSLELGDRAPDFHDLPGADGNQYSLSSFQDKRVLIVVFVGNGCPTVKAYEDRLAGIHKTYADRGVQLVAINSNNPYLSPPDTYAQVARRAKEKGFAFPYLKDEGGEVARRYGAVCTPHIFAFDEERRLRYRGRIDDSRSASRANTHDLAAAIADVLAGREVAMPETTPFGCAIVW